MPLHGYRCPPGGEEEGRANSVEYCVSQCNNPCISPPLLAAMWDSEHTNHHVGAYISASMLAGSNCARQTVLERNEPFWTEPVKRYWPFRGTHAHTMVENASHLLEPYGWLSELRMAVPEVYPDLPMPVLDDEGRFTGEFTDDPLVITVGGTCDCYNPKTLQLYDMKSMADRKVDMMITGSKPGTYSRNLQDSWVVQTNIYRYLLSKTPIPRSTKRKLGLTGTYYPAPTYLGIQGIGMMATPRSGQTVKINRGNRFKPKWETFVVDDVPVWPLEQTEQFVRTKALEWFRYLVLGNMPPVVPKSDDWLCASCAFNKEIYPEGLCSPNAERYAADRAIELTD